MEPRLYEDELHLLAPPGFSLLPVPTSLSSPTGGAANGASWLQHVLEVTTIMAEVWTSCPGPVCFDVSYLQSKSLNEVWTGINPVQPGLLGKGQWLYREWAQHKFEIQLNFILKFLFLQRKGLSSTVIGPMVFSCSHWASATETANLRSTYRELLEGGGSSEKTIRI